MQEDKINGGLKRDIGLGSATILVIANMIGTGIFTTSGFLMQSLQNAQAMLLCWLIGGMLALCGALCYGELGAMFPMAGGEYVFLRKSLGRLTGFLSGWISLIVGFSAPIAAAAIAFASYFFRLVPEGSFFSPGITLIENEFLRITPVTLLAIAIILIFSAVHWYGLRFGSRVQNVLTLFKILVIISFAISGLILGQGSFAHFSLKMDHQTIFSENFATSLIFVSFAYSGWNAAAYLGGEIKHPEKNIPKSLFCGTLFVVVLYILLNVVFVYALSIDRMIGILEVGAKSAMALFGPQMGKGFSAAMTVCLLSVISAMIMAGPRVYYAMAKDGVFFNRAASVTEARHTPGFSILLQAIISTVMVITASFEKLLIYIGFTLSLFAVLTVLGMIVLRVKLPDAVRPYKTFGYPVVPILFILMNLWIIIFSVKGNPVVSLYGGATIFIGVILFFVFEQKGVENEDRSY